MQEVFPQVYLFAVESPNSSETQNLIAIGSKNPERLSMDDPRWRISSNLIIADAPDHYVDTEGMDLARYPILTDDYAPVDYLASKVLPKR